MSDLSLQFLGELKVIREEQRLSLPPSKKTRALLAYLALNEQTFHRETLCELLWEIPDDPRGSLRWSLSKLRKLVDEQAISRIQADRAQVSMDTSDISIDCRDLLNLVKRGLKHCPTEELLHAASEYRGVFLEGLELDSFHDFYIWCLAQREKVLQAQTAVLGELVQRLPPDQAIEHARTLVCLTPENPDAHKQVIQLLRGINKIKEAEQQYQLSKRVLAEYGVDDGGELYRVLHSSVQPASQASVFNAVDSVLPSVSKSIPEEKITHLVGREQESELLLTTYQQMCQDHQTRVVLIQGEPGIGKSFLTQQCANLFQQHQARVLQADAYESEMIRPFAMWIDAFRHAQDLSMPDVLLGERGQSRDAIFAGLSQLISDFTEQQPIVIIFDDVQWIDESSAAVLHYLVRMNRDKPLMVVLAAREQEIKENKAIQQTIGGLRNQHLLQEIRLGPIDNQSLQHIIQKHVPGINGAYLSQECGGNPLMAIELARAEQSSQSGNQHSLSHLVGERFLRMDQVTQDILQWAAMLEPHISVPMLAKVTEQNSECIERALEVGEQQSIIITTDKGYHFTHNLISTAIYEQIGNARRLTMHRRIAEILEVETAVDFKVAADLAHHACKSGDHFMAAKAMVSAGRLCLRFFANEDALRLANRGIELCESLSGAEQVCQLLELHDIKWNAAPVEDMQAAADYAVNLAEQALDYGALPYARLGYQMASYIKWINGQWSEARMDSLQAERVARGADQEDHIMGMAETARCLILLERDLSRADAMLMEAKSLSNRKQFRIAVVPLVEGMLCYYRGEFEKAEEYLQEARTLYKSLGDRINEYQANEYLVMMEIERGEFNNALRHCGQLIAIGEKLKEGSEGPFARAIEALCIYKMNDNSEELILPLQMLREYDAKHRLSYTLIRAAQIDIQKQQYETAIARGQEALEYTDLLNRPSEKLLAHRVLANAHKLLNNSDTAQQHHQLAQELQNHAETLAAWAIGPKELV